MSNPDTGEEMFLHPYRVLDLADEKGVFCTKLLADLGADVVKVEPPGGDKMRFKGPFFHDEIHLEKSLYFLHFNTNKRSITLNLEHKDGQAIFKKLVKSADVVVETFPVGYLEELGLDYERLAIINPRLVMASITPWGQSGPLSGYKSSDLVSMAMSGYMQITGEPDKAPIRLGNEQWHYPPSQYAAVGILAALFYRNTVSGRGQYIDISCQESIITYHQDALQAATWFLTGETVTRIGLWNQSAIPCGAFPCKDGWVAICILSGDEWDTFAQWIHEVTGDEEILDSKYRGGIGARTPYLDLLLARTFDFSSQFTQEEIFEEGQKRNLCVLPLNTVKGLLDDLQLQARNRWVALDHPIAGKLKYLKGCFYSSDVPLVNLRRAAPLLGDCNRDIYCNELGFTPEQLTILRSAGIV